MLKKYTTRMFAMFMLSSGLAHAAPITVDLELVLLADVSGSLDSTDFNLQRDGYAAAFQSATVQNAILGGLLGRIAVSLVYWSDSQFTSVPWTLIDSVSSANNFAASILAAPRPSSGGTGMSSALNYGATQFGSNDYDATRQTIDVSGDGADSGCGTLVCQPVQAARDAFLSGGSNRSINAIWIDDRDFFGDDPEDSINAIAYGTTNVIGGTNSFQLMAQDFNDFRGAVQNKLVREITGGGDPVDVPEPGSLILLGLGLAGFASSRRKFRQA